MNAIFAQIQAELLRTVRNKRFVIFSMLLPLGFYFAFVSSMGASLKVGGTTWNAYYMMSMAAFGVIGGSLSTLGVTLATERVQGFVRVLKTTPLPQGAYLASKMASQWMLSLGNVLLVFLAGAFAEHVQLTASQWLLCGLWIWVGSLPFLALGVLLGVLFQPGSAQVVAQVVYLSMSLLGGLWTPLQFMPKVMQDIAQFLPSYHFAHVSWQLLAGQKPVVADFTNLVCYAVVFMLLSIWVSKRQEAVSV